MRIINGVFVVLMLLFAVVQYNDPDGVFWAAVYGVGAVWCGVAAWRPQIFRSGLPASLYAACLAAAVYGLFHYWPKTPGWWKQNVWWETETAREGMGMMILVLSLIIAGTTVLRERQRASSE